MKRWLGAWVIAAWVLGPAPGQGADARLRVAVLPFTDVDEEAVLGESAARLVMWTLSLNPSVDVLPLGDVTRLARETSCPYLRATPTDKQLAALAKAADIHAVFYGRFLFPGRR